MPSQLNASVHYSIGFKQASFKGIKVPFSGCPVKALSVFEDANLHLKDYTPRTLAVPDNFDKIVYTEDGNFLVECFGQLKNLGGDDKHGLCIYLVTNKSTNEKHALIGFAGQGLSNFNGSKNKTFGEYTISVDGDTSDTIVKMRNPCSELGFHTAKALSIFASLHRLTKGEVEVKIKVGDAEEVCCINSFEDFPAFKKVLQSTKPSDTKKATGPANMPIPSEHFTTVIDEWEARAPAVMLCCLLYKCADYKFYDLVVDLYTRCIKLGVAPDNIRWAEIDPFGDVTWGVGLKSADGLSVLETAAVHLAKHGVDKFPGKNLMGNCLHDLTVILRNPATGEFCCDDDIEEIFENLGDDSDKCFIQLVPDIFWKGDYFPKPAAADVGTSLHFSSQSDEESDEDSHEQVPPELSLWRPVSPDYDPDSPNYVPTSPTDARQDEIKAERIASATRRVRNLVGAFHTRTYSATDEGAEPQFQQRLIEDVEEFLAELKEACPIGAARLEKKREQQREIDMDRAAKRARQGSDDSYGRPASTSRVLHAAPGSPDEAPEDQVRRLRGDA